MQFAPVPAPAAWNEASIPAAGAAPQQPAATDDSWESLSAAPAAGCAASRGGRPALGSPAAAPGGLDGSAEGGEELQFGGGHVLEFYGLTPAVLTQHLEAFLEAHARGHRAPPTLRCAALRRRALPGRQAWPAPRLLHSAVRPAAPAAGNKLGQPCRRRRVLCAATVCCREQMQRLLISFFSAPAPDLPPALPPATRWVDDCHAAVVCSDPAAARQLLAAAAKAGDYKLRGYADAGSGTRKLAASGVLPRPLPGLLCCRASWSGRSMAQSIQARARKGCMRHQRRSAWCPRCPRRLPTNALAPACRAPAELLPPKPRPKTSAAVARRLIGGALNIKLRCAGLPLPPGRGPRPARASRRPGRPTTTLLPSLRGGVALA